MKGHSKGTALITGASSGFGYEIAKCFAEDGHNVVLVGHSQSELRAIADDFEARYGVQAMPIGKEVSTSGAAYELHQEIKEAGITVTDLVNDAGQLDDAALTELFLDDMLERNKGRILQFGSIPRAAAEKISGTDVTITALRRATLDKLGPAEKGARDSYEALMRGDREVISGRSTKTRQPKPEEEEAE